MKAIKRDEQELKDSGIDWVGKMPKAWNLIANKYIMHKEKNICDKWNNEDVLSLTMNGVIVRDLVNPTGKMPTTFDGYQYINKGDLLMCLFDIDVTPRCVGRVFNEGVTSPAYSNFKLNDNAKLGYYYYYYLMMDHTKELLHLAKNLRHSFTEEQLGVLKVPLPPINEQQAIANYLDDRCSKIDAIIAEAKVSIEEYKELKQAVIYEAVTKGLDKNVEMKDSGVEWVEKIPNNWHIVKITRILDKEHPYAIGDGDHGSIKTEQYRDSGIPFIRVQNLGWGTALNMDNVVYISEEDNKQIQNSTLRPNDILFAKTGATIGKTAIMPEEIPIANTTSHVGKISISKEHNSRYIFYVLSSQIGYRQFWDIAIQKTTRPELSIEETKSIKVVLPADKTIEDSIVNYLDEKIPVFDDMINTKASLIEDLEAYKKSLIYEVVTGKRKVVA